MELIQQLVNDTRYDIGRTFKTEEQMQTYCFEWFTNCLPDLRGMLHHNMNNQTNRIAGNQAKALGVVPGVSDFEFIADFAVWFIELKMPNGVQSPEQKRFELEVKKRGHPYIIVYSFREFKQLICKITGRS